MTTSHLRHPGVRPPSDAEPDATAASTDFAEYLDRRRGTERADPLIPFRVQIGVTGHRDPANWQALLPRVHKYLAELRGAFPLDETTPVSFLVLSSLAEGADRLVVREVFKAFSGRVELQAVLPMNLHDYVDDFQTVRSRREFDELLRNADIRTELPGTADRAQAYDRAGRFVVDHSDVVIAVWDGRPAAGVGGTAAIVEYATSRNVPVLVVLASRAAAPDRSPEVRPVSVQTLVRESTLEAYRRIDEFNRITINDERIAPTLVREENRLGAAARRSSLFAQYASLSAWALPLFARADALALKYQRRYYRMGSALYLLAALAVTAVAAQSQAEWSPKLALLEVASMLVVLTIYWIARRTGPHERWLAFRSLAEAFRSSLFMALTQVPADRAQRASDSSAMPAEPWFQRAFSACWEERPATTLKGAGCAGLRRFLVEGWLEDQIRFHHNAVDRLGRARMRLTRVVFLLFGITIVVGLLHAFDIAGGRFWPELFVFLAIALPGFGAALTGIRDQRHYRIHQHRSRRMASRLERLRDQMERSRNVVSVRKTAVQVQNAAAAENLDWSGVIEFQDLEMII
jgi:hypothetical protein